MAYKKDIKPWLKENGYTWEDMDKFWEECCEVNRICKMIADSGKSWNDMTMYQIQQLPTLRETTLAQLKAKEEEERRQAEEEKRKLEETEYYEYYASHFEVMVKKIDDGIALSENELSEIREYSIQRDYGENRRWQRSVHDIVELCGRYFALEWEEGLTESQEDSFMEQPYEVFPYESLEIIKTTKYSKEKQLGISEYNAKNLEDITKVVLDMISQTPSLFKGANVVVSDKEIAIIPTGGKNK